MVSYQGQMERHCQLTASRIIVKALALEKEARQKDVEEMKVNRETMTKGTFCTLFVLHRSLMLKVNQPPSFLKDLPSNDSAKPKGVLELDTPATSVTPVSKRAKKGKFNRYGTLKEGSDHLA